MAADDGEARGGSIPISEESQFRPGLSAVFTYLKSQFFSRNPGSQFIFLENRATSRRGHDDRGPLRQLGGGGEDFVLGDHVGVNGGRTRTPRVESHYGVHHGHGRTGGPVGEGGHRRRRHSHTFNLPAPMRTITNVKGCEKAFSNAATTLG